MICDDFCLCDVLFLNLCIICLENVGIDVEAFKWIANKDLAMRGLSIGQIVSISRSKSSDASSSFFADMIMSHPSLSGKIIQTSNLFGLGQPGHYNIIAQLFEALFSSQDQMISISQEGCDSYMYVREATSRVFDFLTGDPSSEAGGGSNEAIIVLPSGRLSRNADIFKAIQNYVVMYAPLKQRYEHIITERETEMETDSELESCREYQPLHSQGACPRCTSIQQAIEEMFQHTQIQIQRINNYNVHYSETETETGTGTETGLDPSQSDSTTHFFSSPKQKPLYSSITCTAGHQAFPSDWSFYDESYNSVTNRICMLENVCIFDEKLVYFQHEAERKAPEYAKFPLNDIFVFLSLTGLLDIRIDIAPDQSVPENMPFLDTNTWLFTLAAYSFNFAHLLLVK